jgi:predicted RNA methylase
MSEPVFAVPAPENFPQFERIFAEGKLEPFLQRIEERREALGSVIAQPGAEARRAKAVLAALETALALVERIDRIRRSAATSATSGRQLERGTTK